MPDQTESRPVSPWSLMLGTGPRFARDAFGPVVVFYIGWKLVDLRTGILAATALAVIAYLWERPRDRAGPGRRRARHWQHHGLFRSRSHRQRRLRAGLPRLRPHRSSPRRRVRAGDLSLFPRDGCLAHLPPRVLADLAGVGDLSPAPDRHSHDRPPADERGVLPRDQRPHGHPPHRGHHGVVHLVRPPAILDEPGVAPGRSSFRERSSVAAGTRRRRASRGGRPARRERAGRRHSRFSVSATVKWMKRSKVKLSYFARPTPGGWLPTTASVFASNS